MLDDQNDKKLKEAADYYHPAYDDDAWKKMEQLLDEHLPQKKGRRWIIVLIPLLLLLIGGWMYFAVLHNNTTSHISQKIEAKSKLEKTQPTGFSSTVTRENNLPDNIESTKNSSTKNKVSGTSSTYVINENFQKNSERNIASQRKFILKSNSSSALAEESVEPNNSKDNISVAEVSSSVKDNNSKKQNVAIAEEDKDQPKKVANDIDITTKVKRNDDTIAKADNVSKVSQKKKAPTKNSFSKNFGITVSAGPDISGVRLKNAGKITISYGAGLSYSLSPGFTLRSGFYVSKKIYSAESYDYHLPAGTTGGNYLTDVNANCDVYEIPLTINYNFGKTKNHSWFAAAGLSSYLMKKEAYRYNYKDPSGRTYSRNWAIQNQNQHFFSVLDLSGGYQYIFNKRFSLMAEPYISLPLSGIGLGKIKLNSGGVLFTLTAKPF